MRQWREVRFGVDRKDLLESALNRPKHAARYENADLKFQAATLCFGLVKNHPWFGGNKRTATFLTEVFLEVNGLRLVADTADIVEFVLSIDTGDMNVDDIASWVSKRVKKARKD